jgi:hypothetical protein
MSPPVIYRCAFIVRGRGQSHLDELLPAFALAVEASTPLPREEFITKMRSQIQSLVPGGVDDKTADNYRTETIGQILGMYYYDDNDVAQISPRTKQYIETQDQVQFFKNICCLLQAPSGMSKQAKEFVNAGVEFWPAAVLIKVLRLAKDKYNYPGLTKKELNFFVLSNLHALTGATGPEEIVMQLNQYRRNQRPVPIDGGSNTSQHSNEMINLCKYANLVSISGDIVSLNKSETSDADRILSYQTRSNWFDVESYALEDAGGWERLKSGWTKQYGQLPFPNEPEAFGSKGLRWVPDPIKLSEAVELEAPKEGLPKGPKQGTASIQPNTGHGKDYMYPEPVEITANEIGEVGEQYIYVKEYQRVESTHVSETNRIKRVGMIKGIGYDVHSVMAGRGRSQLESENAMYIEVKAEFRASQPKDSFVARLTANEFKAARQLKSDFYLFKVFLVGPAEEQKTFVFALRDPVSPNRLGVSLIPSEDRKHYTITFNRSHCEEVVYA